MIFDLHYSRVEEREPELLKLIITYIRKQICPTV